MVIAILALQGAFIEHEKVLKKLNVDYFEIRKKEEEKKGKGGQSFTHSQIPFFSQNTSFQNTSL